DKHTVLYPTAVRVLLVQHLVSVFVVISDNSMNTIRAKPQFKHLFWCESCSTKQVQVVFAGYKIWDAFNNFCHYLLLVSGSQVCFGDPGWETREAPTLGNYLCFWLFDEGFKCGDFFLCELRFSILAR